ncbi:MAG: anhydro-N-acetylmuramic acid kinase [Burkholderiaceae bacterium]|nr:anhydro-N-acetylmuramic acid kinase [Burkholderiaceae bacterium]
MVSALYIGLMSGTSTDGVDAVLANFGPAMPELLGSISLPMPDQLRADILALNTPGPNELHRAALTANDLARLYAKATQQLLAQNNLTPSSIHAIGAHGQTVRHDPSAGYTVQLNAPALLAELTGIDVIADFRSRDIAAGGQGAPLVPVVHHALFSNGQARAILNLGGIANLTLLDATGGIRGFDTGPANVLMDIWCQEKTGAPYDADGAWAASGQVNTALLTTLLSSEPWLALPPPKSTGRHLFNREWLAHRLAIADPKNQLADQDIQATLQAFTISTVVDALVRHGGAVQELLVCGGGALNGQLMQGLRNALPYPVRPTSDLGMPVQLVEALAFAWLAWAHVQGKPAGLPAVTGARKATLLGCRYPA